MKKVLKIIMVVIIILIILMFTTKGVFALNVDNFKPGAISGGKTIKEFGNLIIGIVQFIGSIISVIALIIIGIKYMTGSVEEKAQYKETLKPYIIGAVLVFSITNLLKIISDIMSGLN